MTPLSMRSPDRRWQVKEFQSRGRQMYLVLERQDTNPSSTVVTGRIVASLELVAMLLGDAFYVLESCDQEY